MDFEEGWRVRCLHDEPIYCEAPHDEDDVLYAGSDDEHYDNSDERRLRYEEAAIRFLQGHTPVLLTTVLRGPFEGPDAKGWINPWQSKRQEATTAYAPKPAPEAMPETTSESEQYNIEAASTGSTTSCHLPSPRSLDQVNITPHPFLEEEELERVETWRNTAESASKLGEEAWPFDTSLLQSQPQSQSRRKRRSTGREWLKRNNKRQRAENAYDIEVASAVAQHGTPSLRRGLPRSKQTSQQQQKQQDLVVEDAAASSESPEASPQYPPADSQAVTTRCSRRSSQVRGKHADASQEEMPAPLSTPIQTPQSSKKSRMTPRKTAHGSTPRNSNVTMVKGESCGNVKEDESKTQRDESFIFRVRPQNLALDITNISPTRRMSFGRLSSPASTAPSETDSRSEILDLDGDTCMADDTKATSPESNAGDKGHHEEAIGKNAEPGLERDGSEPEHSSEKPLPNDNEETLVIVNPIHGEEPEHLESAVQGSPTEQDTVVEAATDRSSQEPTVVAHSASQEDQGKQSTDDAGSTPLPSTSASQFPNSTQPATQLSTSRNRTMPKDFPQSPWSKPSQFTASSPCPTNRSDHWRQHSIMVGASTRGGTPPQNAPETPSMASVAKELALKFVGPSRQQVTKPFCINDKARVKDLVSQHDSPALPASQQSPWKVDVPVMAPPRQQGQPAETSDESSVDSKCQSPWTASPERMRQAAQEALMSTFFDVAKPVSSSPLAEAAVVEPETPLANSTPEAQQPFAAESPRSTLHEPIFSIKSFANFMSPERPRRLSNKTGLSDGHLPSTQNLIAATTDNPWDGVVKCVKRVKWAPLPHEVEDAEDSGPQTPTGPRASSPPPEMAMADLPTGDDDQYQKHFQAVSRRKKLHRHLLPSASQQVFESPAPMAMAEAFVAADSFGASLAPEAVGCVGDTPLSQNNTESQESMVDDVDDVLRNLNEFIEMVDFEADLARGKEEERRGNERRQQQRSQRLGGAFTSDFTFDGMMDAGVWD